MAIDLRGTDKADIIERFLEDSVAQGNEGDATVERLELDGVNLSFRFQIQHKQVFKERVLGQTIKFTVYDVTTPVEGQVNVIAPNPNDVTFGVDTPVGTIRFSILDIIGIFAGLAV